MHASDSLQLNELLKEPLSEKKKKKKKNLSYTYIHTHINHIAAQTK
jgi:hypothetical protein